MDENNGRDLSGLNLHGQMAAATRCVRRLFPTFFSITDWSPVDLLTAVAASTCDVAIGMAESFCDGEPGDVSQARLVAAMIAPLELLEEHDGKNASRTRDGYGSHNQLPLLTLIQGVSRARNALSEHKALTFAVRAVARLSWATERAFHSIDRSPLSQSDCNDIRHHAAGAVVDAHETALRLAHSVMPLFADQFTAAFCSDVDTLCRSHTGAITTRGIPVDTSDNGELGPLWGSATGQWRTDFSYPYRRPRLSPSVKSAREYLDRAKATRPDIVCRYFSNAEGGEASQLKSEVQQIVGLCNESAPPVVAIYGPDIEAALREELVTLGAVVCTHFPPELEPSDDETLAIAIGVVLKEAYFGWSNDKHGFWTCTDPRVVWRYVSLHTPKEPRMAAELAPLAHVAATPPKESPIAEAYMSALKYLESGADWGE
jgi:hypothetical protein